MNAPIRTLAPSESRANDEILSEIEWAIDEGEEARFHVIQRPLLAIFPRCNCRNVLRFSPWLDGLRVVKCEACGWKTLEAPLNDTELAAHARR